MNSRTSRRFWQLYHELPAPVQRLAQKNYRLWLSDPSHPSLNFKLLRGSERRFSVRVGGHYRALGERVDDGIRWVWIGSHADYDKILGR